MPSTSREPARRSVSTGASWWRSTSPRRPWKARRPGPQTVIIKFESAEKAKAWYNSKEYQAVVGKRLAATSGFAVLSEAMRVKR